MKRAIFSLTAAFALGLAAVGCDDPVRPEPEPQPTGTLTIVTATTGSYQAVGLDPYRCRIDGEEGGLGVGANDTHVHRLLAGVHAVEITGLPANCTVEGENPRYVNVVEDEDVQVEFEISCS